MITENNQMPGAVQTPAEWRGYNLEELKYRLALALIKLESHKALLASKLVQGKERGGREEKGFMSGLLRRISDKMTLVDYLLIGFNLSKLVLKLRRKR